MQNQYQLKKQNLQTNGFGGIKYIVIYFTTLSNQIIIVGNAWRLFPEF